MHYTVTQVRAAKFLLIFLFHTLCKIHQMLTPLKLKFGTLKGIIKANLGTKFGENLIKIHGVTINYSYKIISNFCHTYKINRFEKSFKNWLDSSL